MNAVNKIGTVTRASIDGDSTLGITADDLTLTAKDESTIKADAGAVSLGGAFAGSVGASLSIGVALARNELANVVESYIVNADQGVTVSSLTMLAEEKGSITSRTAAASLAVGAGGIAGAGLSGAGAAAVNIIGTDTRAFARDSRLISTGTVDLDAKNISTIDAKVAAVSAAVGGSLGVGIGVAIGAAVATNEIGAMSDDMRDGAEVLAYLDDTSVQAGGDLTLDALSQQTITSTVAAGSVAAAVGKGAGIAAAGSGVRSENTIRADVRAFIDGDGSTGITAPEVQLSAQDVSTIEADAGSASVAAAFGGTVAISAAVGVTLAKNTIQNVVEATIEGADSLKAIQDGISLLADEKSKITSTATAATAAVALTAPSVFSAAFSGGTTTAENLLDSEVSAVIDSSDVVANGGVKIIAADTSKIDATISSQSLAAGIVGIAIGLSKAESMLKNQVQATIQDSQIKVPAGDVVVTSSSAPTNLTQSTVSAVAAALISGAAAGASANTTIDGITSANIDGGSVTVDNGNLKIRAVSDSSSKPVIDGSAAGGVAMTALEVDAIIQGTTEAIVSAGSTLRADQGNVTVEAVSNTLTDARTKSSSVGILLNVNESAPKAHVIGQTSAMVLGQIIGPNGQPGANNVTVKADAIDNSAAGAQASGGGLINVGKSKVDAKTSPTVEAVVGGIIRASGAVTVSADSTTDAEASSRSSGGGLVTVTDLKAAAEASALSKAEVKPDTVIQAGSTLTVSALHGGGARGVLRRPF